MRSLFYIAKRYFFTKNTQSLINIINYIAFVVIIITTTSLFIVLSGFSGIRKLSISLSSSLTPDYRIENVEGKTIEVSTDMLEKIKNLSYVESVSGVIEDKIFLSFKNNNQIITLKGVDNNFTRVIKIDSVINYGKWLNQNHKEDIIVGYNIAINLGISLNNKDELLKVTVPNNSKNTILKSSTFISKSVIPVGVYQMTDELDSKYAFVNIGFAQNLFGYSSNQFTAIEIKTLSNNVDAFVLKKDIKDILNMPVKILDKFQLNSILYKMLNTENIIIYLIFTLIMIIAMFNVIGSLVMIVLEKKTQFKILNAIGISFKNIQIIFFLLGNIITWFGGCVGLLLGIIIVSIQIFFPFLYVPNTSIAYPIAINAQNIIIVILTFSTLGIIASIWGSRGVLKEKNS